MYKKTIFFLILFILLSCSSNKTVKNDNKEVKNIKKDIKIYEKYYKDNLPLYSIEGKIVTLKDLKNKYPDFARIYDDSLNQRMAELLKNEIYSYLKENNIKNYKIYLPLKRVDISKNEKQSEGKEKAPFTVVVYSDFQCPYCKKFFNEFDRELLKKDDVKFVFKNFPLPFHEKAKGAALASICASKQGKFWQYHDKLFENQDYLGDELYLKLADELKLDKTKFMQCLADKETEKILQKDIDEAKKIGVRGTPTYFLNGVLYDKDRDINVFNDVYKNYLKNEGELKFKDLENEKSVICEINGKKYTLKGFFNEFYEVEIKIKNKIAEETYSTLKKVIESDVVNEVFTKEAKAEKFKTPNEYLDFIIKKEVKEPTDEEAQNIYDVYKDKFNGLSFEQVKDRLKDFLKQNRIKTFISSKNTELIKKYKVKALLTPPKFFISERNSPILGKTNAKNTVYIFSDFQCPYCAMAAPIVEKLVKEINVKVVYKFFPLNFHKMAMPSAIAAYCAYKQGNFWKFHDKAFANQKDLSHENFLKWASELKLNTKKFEKCLSGSEAKKKVAEDVKEAENIGVAGTPSIYINGVLYEDDPRDINKIKRFIENISK